MLRSLCTLGLALLLVGSASTPGRAESILIQGDPGDFELVDFDEGEIGPLAFVTNVNSFRLFTGFASGHNIVFIFDLDQVPTGLSVFQAGLSAQLAEIFTSTSFQFDPFNGDLYGVGFSSSPGILPAGLDFYTGPAPGSGSAPGIGTLIQNNYVTSSSPVGQYIQTTEEGSVNLANYINTFRPSGPEGRYLFLRINPDVIAFPNGEVAGFVFFSANSPDKPLLTIEAVPEPSALALAAIGGALVGAVALRRRRPAPRGPETR